MTMGIDMAGGVGGADNFVGSGVGTCVADACIIVCDDGLWYGLDMVAWAMIGIVDGAGANCSGSSSGGSGRRARGDVFW